MTANQDYRRFSLGYFTSQAAGLVNSMMPLSLSWPMLGSNWPGKPARKAAQNTANLQRGFNDGFPPDSRRPVVPRIE